MVLGEPVKEPKKKVLVPPLAKGVDFKDALGKKTEGPAPPSISNRMSKMEYVRIASVFDRKGSDMQNSKRDVQSKVSMLSPSNLDFIVKSGLHSDRTTSG